MFHLVEEFAVRRLMVAALAALTSLVVNAAEPVAVEAPAADVAAVVADQAVTVTPVPMPVRVTELRVNAARATEVRSTRQSKSAKTRSIEKSMLSRTERHQVALLSAKPATGTSVLRTLVNDGDEEYAAEDLVLHRSFNRPKVVKVTDQDDEDDLLAIPETVKLRLYLARMKAVEALVLARVADQPTAGDDDLPDTVRQRLLLARTKSRSGAPEEILVARGGRAESLQKSGVTGSWSGFGSCCRMATQPAQHHASIQPAGRSEPTRSVASNQMPNPAMGLPDVA